MTPNLLGELKALQRERGHGPLFPSHLDFQKWADRVEPLLSFDSSLRSRFADHTRSADISLSFGSTDSSYSNINQAVGIVNQAVHVLELQAQQPPAAGPAPNTEVVTLPNTLTLKWLWEHALVGFYFWFAGLLFAAFALGVYVAKTPAYALLKSTVSSTVTVK